MRETLEGMADYFRRVGRDIKECVPENWDMIVAMCEPVFIYHQIPPYDLVFPDENSPKYSRIERKIFETGIGLFYTTVTGFITSVQIPFIAVDNIRK